MAGPLLATAPSQRGIGSVVLERCRVGAGSTVARSVLLMAESDVERTDELRIFALDR